ncbi:hypothetical protein Smp_063060 [Schistosoma mansoni]|uniref:hypothetical protein n=1 Tax=Schistosoma mansoni TaxID=6183 RepID=UPI0001A63F59|nr:hypothetical protein Smp_063060 [Schistosoma mansoni]|eukprot:XP_018653288.1 hypothetical protein Smp_063060 [Schistosoma mansoni]
MNQGDTILGLTRSRLHFTQIKYKTDSLNVRLYGNIGDTYNIRFSTRRSPKHALDGYPELDQTSTISVCLVQNTKNSTMTTSNLQTLCEYPINSHRVLRMCLNSGNGIYYLQLNGNPNFKNRQPTNYCEFPKHTLSKQIKQTIKPIYCQTTYGMHSLELTIPAYHHTCNIISNGCYPKVPTECRQNYPKYLPSTFDPLMSSSVILNSNSSNQIPVCMIDEY